jgi:hypothetical protein
VGVGSETVWVKGPRVGRILYRLWISAQVTLLVSAIVAFAVALVARDWRYVAIGAVVAVAHWIVSGSGAGCLWEMMNLTAFVAGTRGETTEFPLAAVRDVRIGLGWARNGLWLAILPYIPALNKLSEGLCVSFEAPDRATAGDVVYALYMRSKDDAIALARLLQAIQSTSGSEV